MVVLLCVPAVLVAGWLLGQLARLYGKGWGWAIDRFDWAGAVGYLLLTPAALFALAMGLLRAFEYVVAHAGAIGGGIGRALLIPWCYVLYRVLRSRVLAGRKRRRYATGRLTPEEQARADQLAFNTLPSRRTPEQQVMADRHVATNPSAWVREQMAAGSGRGLAQ